MNCNSLWSLLKTHSLVEWHTNHIKRVAMMNYLGKHNDRGFMLTEDNEIKDTKLSEGIQEKQAFEVKLKDYASTNFHSYTCNRIWHCCCCQWYSQKRAGMSSESMVNVQLEALGWVEPGTLDARHPPKPFHLCNWTGERKYSERFMS